MKKFSLVTPCYNAEKYIEETVLSVITQTAILSGRAELEYIICDGKSSDQTVKLVEDIKDKYNCNLIEIISEPDSGMYEALSKGLQLASGDIIAYLNAGDYYHKCAFDVVLEMFELKGVSWLTGYDVGYNDKSQVVYVQLPYRYRREFFTCGFFSGTILPHVQQESTFWSSSLNELIDYDELAKFKYAGDFYLWLQFSKVYELKIVMSFLGGFRKHEGQLSQVNREAHQAEILAMSAKPRVSEYILASFDKFLWYTPAKIKKFFNRDGLFIFDRDLEEWI